MWQKLVYCNAAATDALLSTNIGTEKRLLWLASVLQPLAFSGCPAPKNGTKTGHIPPKTGRRRQNRRARAPEATARAGGQP